MTAWSGKPPASVMSTETPEQRDARVRQENAAKAAKQIETEANRLIGLINSAIAGQSSGSAATYPGDKQYSVAGRWAPAVVNRAIEIWESTEGVGYHTMTSVKHTGIARMGDTQTNFICKIIGPPTKPDHDAMEHAKEQAAAPAMLKAAQFRDKRDLLDEQAQLAKTNQAYNATKRQADFAHKDMNRWLDRADNDRLFKEQRMARHNIHVTHAVPKQA